MPSNKCVIFDLDGTLAINDHREHFLQQNPKDWKSFFDACPQDTPNHYVIWLFKILQTRVKVFICSGRPDSHWYETAQWLALHTSVPINHAVGSLIPPHGQPEHHWKIVDMLMRRASDRRADTEIKREMLERIYRHGWEPVLAVDDRPTVVRMWRENKVPCLVVNNPNWAIDAVEVEAASLRGVNQT